MSCCYQLSCGHWVSDPLHWETGQPYACYTCGTTRTQVIGWTRPQEASDAT